MAQTWKNADNLYIKYGTAEGTPGHAGEYEYDGPTRMVELTLDLTTVGSASAIVEDNVYWPVGARLEKVDVVTITAAVGSGAVLNFGIARNSDRSTAIDADGFIAAIPTTSMDTAGETTSLTAGSTYAGALIGTTNPTYVGILVADYDTAAFTAGLVAIRLFWSVPTT